jgi:hypothetical protein
MQCPPVNSKLFGRTWCHHFQDYTCWDSTLTAWPRWWRQYDPSTYSQTPILRWAQQWRYIGILQYLPVDMTWHPWRLNPSAALPREIKISQISFLQHIVILVSIMDKDCVLCEVSLNFFFIWFIASKFLQVHVRFANCSDNQFTTVLLGFENVVLLFIWRRDFKENDFMHSVYL